MKKLLQLILKNLISEIILFQQYSAGILGDSVVWNTQQSHETPDRLRSTNLPLWKYFYKNHYLCVNYARGLLCYLTIAKLPFVLSICKNLSTFSPSLFCGQLEVSVDAALLHKPLELLTVCAFTCFMMWNGATSWANVRWVLWEPTW